MEPNEEPLPVMDEETRAGMVYDHGDIDSFLAMLKKVHQWHLDNDLSAQMTITLGKDFV